MPRVIWSVEMHNVFKISLVVRREALSITLSVDSCADLKNIVHLYRVRVTKFSTWGGGRCPDLYPTKCPRSLGNIALFDIRPSIVF